MNWLAYTDSVATASERWIRPHWHGSVVPPRSVLLVHGAGSGPEVYREWMFSFPGAEVVAVDLQRGLAVSTASMDDYTSNLVRVAERLPPPVAVCGWSMGGLVALMAVSRMPTDALALVEPSPPAEIQGHSDDTALMDGLFDPEEVYGRFPEGMVSRMESARARSERKRGISVPSVPCRCLVVHGSSFPLERGREIALFYRARESSYPHLDHWGLILSPAVRDEVARFLME